MLGEVKMEKGSSEADDVLSAREAGKISGYIYVIKMTKTVVRSRSRQVLEKQYLRLRENFLYVFDSSYCTIPQRIIFLEALIVSEHSAKEDQGLLTPQGSTVFGLRLTNERQTSIHFYLESKEQQLKWLRALRQSAHTVPIEEFYRIGQQIGIGRFATVYEGTSLRTGKLYAIKVCILACNI
jgi:hypothetical protein